MELIVRDCSIKSTLLLWKREIAYLFWELLNYYLPQTIFLCLPLQAFTEDSLLNKFPFHQRGGIRRLIPYSIVHREPVTSEK